MNNLTKVTAHCTAVPGLQLNPQSLNHMYSALLIAPCHLLLVKNLNTWSVVAVHATDHVSRPCQQFTHLVFQLALCLTSAEKSQLSRSVAERRIPSHGDWKDNIRCTGVAWLLFSFRLLATKLFSAPLYKTWLHRQTLRDYH